MELYHVYWKVSIQSLVKIEISRVVYIKREKFLKKMVNDAKQQTPQKKRSRQQKQLRITHKSQDQDSRAIRLLWTPWRCPRHPHHILSLTPALPEEKNLPTLATQKNCATLKGHQLIVVTLVLLAKLSSWVFSMARLGCVFSCLFVPFILLYLILSHLQPPWKVKNGRWKCFITAACY